MQYNGEMEAERDCRLAEYRARRSRADVKARMRELAATPEARARARVREAKLRKKNPKHKNAHQVVWRNIGYGKLIRLPCENCGREPTHAHHEDYSQPLVVTWLCPRCHTLLHDIKGTPR